MSKDFVGRATERARCRCGVGSRVPVLGLLRREALGWRGGWRGCLGLRWASGEAEASVVGYVVSEGSLLIQCEGEAALESPCLKEKGLAKRKCPQIECGGRISKSEVRWRLASWMPLKMRVSLEEGMARSLLRFGSCLSGVLRCAVDCVSRWWAS